MSGDTFTSAGKTREITIFPAPADGKKYPILLLCHGSAGLVAPFGDQIRNFAKDLAGQNYVTAVPQLFEGDSPPAGIDADALVATLTDAVAMVARRPDADRDRLGLVGFSLGASTVMTYAVSKPVIPVKAIADFYGFLTPEIRDGVGDFPPTIIFHNRNDRIVPVENSLELDRLLAGKVEHQLVGPYDEDWLDVNHSFRPGGAADLDSQAKTKSWFAKHLPSGGR